MTRIEFFSKIENKYNIELSKNRPIILRFDARNTTKNKKIDLLDESIHHFSYALKETARILSNKYKCLVYVASDELNIIILHTRNFLVNFKSNYAQEITATLSQEISYYFHQYYKDNFIIFAGRAFSIYEDNINSYLLYRKHTNIPVLTMYYVKRNSNINTKYMSYKKLHQYALENLSGYENRTNFQKEGICYYRNIEYPIEMILTNNLSKLNKPNIQNQIKQDDDI